jgi:hypothetical protein
MVSWSHKKTTLSIRHHDGTAGDEIVEDVVGESVLPKREDLALPMRVVGVRLVQHNRHEGPDVVHSSVLSVESGDVISIEGGLRCERRSLMVDRRMGEDETLRGGHLGSQGYAHGTLVLQGEGRSSLALLRGSHDGLDGGDGGDQRGVGGERRRGRDDVVLGGYNEGGKAQRGASAPLLRCGRRRRCVGEGPEAGDVGGPPTTSSLRGTKPAREGPTLRGAARSLAKRCWSGMTSRGGQVDRIEGGHQHSGTRGQGRGGDGHARVDRRGDQVGDARGQGHVSGRA